MKRFLLRSWLGLFIVILIPLSSWGEALPVCLWELDGSCSLEISNSVSSEYFATTLPKIEVQQTYTETILSPQTDDDSSPTSSLETKEETITVVEQAYTSFKIRCLSIMKMYQQKQNTADFSMGDRWSSYCGSFKKLDKKKIRGEILEVRQPLKIYVPPGSKIQFLLLHGAHGHGMPIDSVKAQSALLRGCDLLNSYFLSQDDVYFSYCKSDFGASLTSNDIHSDFQSYSKELIIYSKPSFNLAKDPVVEVGSIHQESLEEPTFALHGTRPEFLSAWEPTFPGGSRHTLLLEVSKPWGPDGKDITGFNVETEEIRRQRAETRRPWAKYVEEDLGPKIDNIFGTLGGVAAWLTKQPKSDSPNK